MFASSFRDVFVKYPGFRRYYATTTLVNKWFWQIYLVHNTSCEAHCEPEEGLWSNKMCCMTKTQLGVPGSHSPGQQFSLSLVEAEDGWSRFPLSKAGQLLQQGSFHAE